jgi:hypothetical protein
MRTIKAMLILAPCLITACTTGTPSASVPATIPAPTAAVVASSPSADLVPPTIAAPAPSGPIPFDSAAYPYSLTLPRAALTRKWHPATRQWDGTERIDSVSAFVDTTGTVDGGLFILGTPWAADVAGFGDLVSANVARFHGCSVPAGVRSVEIAGGPAIAYRQVCTDQPVVRVIIVGHGFGLAASEQVRGGTEERSIDDLLVWFETFAWRQ